MFMPGRPASRWIPIALASLVVLPASDAGARRDPPNTHMPTPVPARDLAEPSGMAALLAAADDITRQVVALRGLETRRPIARGVLSREEIGRKLNDRIAKEYTPGEIKVESRFLKRLGLLPPETDYLGLLTSLLQEQVAGFYDPFSRQLYIADWLGLELQRPAMAHEIEHALQDQHFDLKQFAAPIKDDGDRQLARAALVEGDGTAVMLEFVAQSNGLDASRLPDAVISSIGKQIAAGAMDQSPIYSRAPRFLRETLLFPYFAGMQFVHALRRGHTWARINEVWRAPPESTEQVIHPEKYLAGERPVQVTASPLASLAPRTELRRDVLGELELRVLFASRMPDGDAERAAAGWAGDRMVVYGEADSDKPVVVIDLSAWDSEADAREAEAALRAVIAHEGAAARPAAEGAVLPAVVEREGEAWSVERRGQKIVALFGAPVEARAALADEVWAGFSVAALPDVPAARPSAQRPKRAPTKKKKG